MELKINKRDLEHLANEALREERIMEHYLSLNVTENERIMTNVMHIKLDFLKRHQNLKSNVTNTIIANIATIFGRDFQVPVYNECVIIEKNGEHISVCGFYILYLHLTAKYNDYVFNPEAMILKI